MVMDIGGMDGFYRGAAPNPVGRPEAPRTPPLPLRRVAACGNFDAGLFQGKVAAPFAQDFWLNLDDKTQRVMLWDVPMEQRAMTLQDCWFKADYVGLACTGNKVSPSMACWMAAIGPGSKCAMVHFCFARSARQLAMEIGIVLLDQILVETQFRSLIGLLPATYRHAIDYVKRLGFQHAATLTRACPIAGRGAVDGVLVTMNLEAICYPLASPAPTQPEPQPKKSSFEMTLPPLLNALTASV